ncbi:AraC family transcriptional regulator [Solihabitans fulvus]|uniref:AraC family transcriptional regulator n=1 Tax=Solihabitans fulvus TaxID=1892852 RepID=A0A5B2WLV7_9PSEU|nr:AraC family transcriptional regulator [Solihabitans fulvus]KAA2252415.1 AraC family transcriptional regulator [Solihabitans fulvus]
MAAPSAEPTDSAAVPRLILSASGQRGADRKRLADAAGLAQWALADDSIRIPAAQTLRLWDLTEAKCDTRYVGVRGADYYRPGMLGMFDRLVVSAPDVGSGLRVASSYARLATSAEFAFAERAGEAVLTVAQIPGDGNSRALAAEFILGVVLNLIRKAAGRPVTPARVEFASPAPHAHAEHAELYGTASIDFDQPADALVFRADDMRLPLPTADPVAAGRLRGRADTLVSARRATTWRDWLRHRINARLSEGTASLDAVARDLYLSPRTLQRRLGEQDTTWRAELDAVRRQRAVTLLGTSSPTRADLAEELGYSAARAARRTLRRWEVAAVKPTDPHRGAR